MPIFRRKCGTLKANITLSLDNNWASTIIYRSLDNGTKQGKHTFKINSFKTLKIKRFRLNEINY